jgi:activator of HSP90 ATPase
MDWKERLRLSLFAIFTQLLVGCSSDPVLVTTSSNNPTQSDDGSGASVTVAGSSADGTVVVTGSGGSSAGGSSTGGSGSSGVIFTRYVYEADANGVTTFCLEDSGSLILWSSSESVLALNDSGCAAVELARGSYDLDLLIHLSR